MRLPVLVCVLLTLAASPAPAVELEEDCAGLRVRVFAPDWIWQGETANYLVIVEAPEGLRAAKSITARLTAPTTPFESQHRMSSETFSRELRLEVEPGTRARGVIARLVPRTEIEPEEVELTLRLEVPGEEGVIIRRQLPLRILRGSLVPGGSLSVLIPAGIALLALPVFLWILSRHARRGWWRRLPDPLAEPAEAA